MFRKMRVLASIGLMAAIAFAADKDAPFRPGSPSSYPSCQTVGKLKMVAVKYESDGETKPVFGNVNPNEKGILPILLIMENTGDDTYMLNNMRVEYQVPGREQLVPIDARDLAYLSGPVKAPQIGTGIPIPIKKKKSSPLGKVEFETRAFAAKTLLKGESANGFFYFQTRHNSKAILYVTGIREGSTGKELFYAELPIDRPQPAQP